MTIYIYVKFIGRIYLFIRIDMHIYMDVNVHEKSLRRHESYPCLSDGPLASKHFDYIV